MTTHDIAALAVDLAGAICTDKEVVLAGMAGDSRTRIAIRQLTEVLADLHRDAEMQWTWFHFMKQELADALSAVVTRW